VLVVKTWSMSDVVYSRVLPVAEGKRRVDDKFGCR